MHTLKLVMPYGLEDIEEFDSLKEAVGYARTYWNESDGPQTFLVVAAENVVEATLTRPQGDPEFCLTFYRTGLVERHRCRYLLDDQQRYNGVVVTAL